MFTCSIHVILGILVYRRTCCFAHVAVGRLYNIPCHIGRLVFYNLKNLQSQYFVIQLMPEAFFSNFNRQITFAKLLEKKQSPVDFCHISYNDIAFANGEKADIFSILQFFSFFLIFQFHGSKTKRNNGNSQNICFLFRKSVCCLKFVMSWHKMRHWISLPFFFYPLTPHYLWKL